MASTTMMASVGCSPRCVARLPTRASPVAPLRGVARPAVGPARRGGAMRVMAAAAPVELLNEVNPTGLPIGKLDEATRSRLAEEWGYRKIGKELPDDVTLGQIVKSMPSDVFELNPLRAWGAVVTSIVSMALCEYLISISPWYMLPFAWALAGTAFTGFFVVGHDAGHRTFSKNKLLEDIVGTLMFMPLIYPFEPWRIKHNQHHAYTNKLVDDTAWHPVMESEVEQWSGIKKVLYQVFLGSPLKLWASVGHWAIWHFDLNKYTESQKPRVLVSLAAVFAFMAVGFPALIYYTGWAGWAKYWLMPWLGYHFWMSTFTVVHHTAPHIPFKPEGEWNPAKAQLSGTVHCDFPAWVEFLTHDISVHVPHHVSTGIPWYNLRKATDSLRANWGEYMTECTFNWRMMKQIFTELHVYDDKTNYKPFDWKKEEGMWKVQRQVLPDSM